MTPATGATRRDHWDLLNQAKARVWANSGGPASRQRTEWVIASLLRDGPAALMPRVIRAGLDFGEREPLDAVLETLARAGLDDAELLRERFAVPATPLLVRVVPDARWCARVTLASDDAVLEQALLLGLCTAYQFDPARPVLWTRASLLRRVELYQPAGFYS